MVRVGCLKTYYDIEKTIGSGGFGKVKLATHILTGEKVAVKIIDKKCLGSDYPRILLELEALKAISHHYICKLYQFIETDTHFFMIMEYCAGGELFDYIVQKTRLSDAEARTFFRQILSAVAYLHENGFAHRDLKPENILLDSSMNLKLIDFGLCARPSGGMTSLLKTSCGSPHYAAPELIQGHQYFGAQIDIWSLGVLLYTLLCGVLPFDDDSVEGLYKKIIYSDYDEPNWLTPNSRSLISLMLKKNPRHRITVESIKLHPWVTMNSSLIPVLSASQIKHNIKDNACIQIMSKHYCVTEEEMWNRLKDWKYDYDTATYLVLMSRSNAGLPTCLKLSNALDNRVESPVTVKREPEKFDKEKENCICTNVDSVPQQKAVPGRANVNRGEGWMTPTRTRRKRAYVEEDESPVPPKKTPGKELHPALVKPASKKCNTPGNKLMQSIERKINQVREVVTPKRKKLMFLPAVISLKSTCNVSTTMSKDPCKVVKILMDSLDSMGIRYKIKKGFRLLGEVSSKSKSRGCSFELEVCLVKGPTEEVVGIRRKRLNGDSWAYKGICEQILSITQTQ